MPQIAALLPELSASAGRGGGYRVTWFRRQKWRLWATAAIRRDGSKEAENWLL